MLSFVTKPKQIIAIAHADQMSNSKAKKTDNVIRIKSDKELLTEFTAFANTLESLSTHPRPAASLPPSHAARAPTHIAMHAQT